MLAYKTKRNTVYLLNGKFRFFAFTFKKKLYIDIFAISESTTGMDIILPFFGNIRLSFSLEFKV